MKVCEELGSKDQPAADASRVTGRRAARKPRINYLDLLGGILAEQNADPNTPSQRGKQAGRRQALEQHQDQQEQKQAKAGQAAGPKAAGKGGKRKAAALQAPNEEAVSLEAAQELSRGLQRAGDDDEAAGQATAAGPAAAAAAGRQDSEAEWNSEDEAAPRRKQRQTKRRQRRLVDMHGAAAAGHQEPDDCDNEFERARLERIRRNQEVLAQLGICQMAQDLVTTCNQPAQQQAGEAGAQRSSRPRERRLPAAPAEAVPCRKSARMRGLEPSAANEAQAQLMTAESTDKDHESAGLLELEEYFALVGKDVSSTLVVDGHYHGWVSPAVCERYGIAGDPDEAWEAGGGGKFSFKIDKKAIPANLRSKGWSDARAFAHTMLKKNPNSYFYRHVAPHEQQAQGEWTEEEHELFLSTARANGVGDKWGLFASYIPQRVGYQCSAYYRDVIIPQGLVLDKRFKITRNGRAVFVGQAHCPAPADGTA
ncbi:hypothetical protein N2152v2_004335 [Parachlorella kessleri]